jgi:hypothetical protein
MTMYVQTPDEAADVLIRMVDGDGYGIAVFPTREMFVLAVREDRDRLLFGGFDDSDGPTFAVELEREWRRETLVEMIAASLGVRS